MNNLNDSSSLLPESNPHSSRQHPPSSSTSKPNEQFLQEPTLAFLESYSNHLRPSLAPGIFVLSLARLQLNSIGDIGQFQHIQICDLSSNFIESIDSLILNCPSLIKLDLHSNRVSIGEHTLSMIVLSDVDQPFARWRTLESSASIESSLSSR